MDSNEFVSFLINLRELIQDDLLCIMDEAPDSMQAHACQAVVDRINQAIRTATPIHGLNSPIGKVWYFADSNDLSKKELVSLGWKESQQYPGELEANVMSGLVAKAEGLGYPVEW